MDFENSAGGSDSYEKPPEGKYMGVLVGFAYIGIQPGGQYGPKARVMLRWELHKRKGPSVDSKGFVHTITARFGATVKGENSLLKQCLEAHGIEIPEGSTTKSQSWLGHAAWLDLEESIDGKYTNVSNYSKLDPEDDVAPTRKLELEHWEPSDKTTPPIWARHAISKSSDIAHLVAKKEAETVSATANDDDIPF
jgi:hypothetical protein